MKIALKIFALLALLGVIGWQQWQIQEQRRDFDSVVSHFNALEEGVAMQATIDLLENRIAEVNEKSDYAHRLIDQLNENDSAVIERFKKQGESS